MEAVREVGLAVWVSVWMGRAMSIVWMYVVGMNGPWSELVVRRHAIWSVRGTGGCNNFA